MRLDFRPSAAPTIGVEWEFALVDRHSRDLVSAASDLIAEATPALPDPTRLHRELLRNTVEIVTDVSATVPDAVADLRRSLEGLLPAADALGIDLFGAGTHPFARWSSQQVTEGDRYEELINRTQWWGRQMLIWGVHVHVGMPERDRVMKVITALLDTFPHLQALSASSPIWAGTDTGYASNRALMFQQLPTAGLPFAFDTWQDYEACIADQMKTGVIERLGDIRWDIRPAPLLGTVENRVCDGLTDIREVGAVTALIQCLVVDLDRRIAAGEHLRPMPPWHVQENKWRAARYGLDAIVIVSAEGTERLVTDDLIDLIDRLTPLARELGCADELAAVADIPGRGASYQRQRAVADQTGGDLVAVVDSVTTDLLRSL